MPSYTEMWVSFEDFLTKLLELKEPSIREVGESLGWNYSKAHSVAKALESLGFIKFERVPGPPLKHAIRLTEKGQCLIRCISQE